MVSTTINRPKHKVYKNFAKLARLKKQRKKHNRKPKEYTIPDGHLMPQSMIRKHLKHPTCNAELSGKKKRKIINSIRRAQNKASKMEVQSMDGGCCSSSSCCTVVKADVKDVVKDVEMKEEESPSTSS